MPSSCVCMYEGSPKDPWQMEPKNKFVLVPTISISECPHDPRPRGSAGRPLHFRSHLEFYRERTLGSYLAPVTEMDISKNISSLPVASGPLGIGLIQTGCEVTGTLNQRATAGSGGRHSFGARFCFSPCPDMTPPLWHQPENASSVPVGGTVCRGPRHRAQEELPWEMASAPGPATNQESDLQAERLSRNLVQVTQAS